MEKPQILMKKFVYFGLLIIELNKTIMHEAWYDYAKVKYDAKAKAKRIIFRKKLEKMLEQGLPLQNMS